MPGCNQSESRDKGKLGLSQFPKTTFSDVPFSVKLHLPPGVCIVSLTTNDVLVQIQFILSKNIIISYHPCMLIGVSLHLVLMAVCMSGVGVFDPFHFMLKFPDTDNAL